MPVNIGKDNEGCFAKWGQEGKKYYYECGNEVERNNAKNKAYKQGVAIGDLEVTDKLNDKITRIKTKYLVGKKISFDYDGTLTERSIQQLVQRLITAGGNEIYIISARSSSYELMTLGQKLGISQSHIYATGSNKEKINTIKRLGINTHYDNNPDVIKELPPNVGKLV